MGDNTWNGVVYDKGLVTSMVETSYKSNKIIQQSRDKQENLNQYLVDGFERNKVLIPNIINLEFMFDDPEVSSFTMNNYFGLYLTENPFLEYKYVGYVYNEKTFRYETIKLDQELNPIHDEVVSERDSELYQSGKYDSKLIFALTNDVSTRVQNVDDFNTFINDSVVNKPY